MSLTPEQFNQLATKDDLNQVKNNLKNLEEKTSRDKDEILTAVDGLAKKFDNFHAELAANQAAHDRFEKSISDLKKRIGELERKV